MHMFGSHSFSRRATLPYSGIALRRDPAMMRLSRESVHEATIAERLDCPAGHYARLRLAALADPSGLHRMHPGSPVFAMSCTFGYDVEQHVEHGSARAEVKVHSDMEEMLDADEDERVDALMGPDAVPQRPTPANSRDVVPQERERRTRYEPSRLADEMTRVLFRQKRKQGGFLLCEQRTSRVGGCFQVDIASMEEPACDSHAEVAATLVHDTLGEDLHAWPSLGCHAPETIIFMCTDPGCPWYFCVAGTLLELPRKLHRSVRVYIPYPKATYHGTPPTVDGLNNEVGHGNVGSALVTRCVAPTSFALAVPSLPLFSSLPPALCDTAAVTWPC